MSKLLKIIKEEIDKLSLDNIKQYLINYFDLNNVVEPSTIPIKDGYIRLFHQTSKENFEKIKKEGSIKLNYSTGKQNQEPIVIWGSEKPFYGSPKEHYTIEYQVPRDDADVGRVNRDIHSDEIIAFHDPILFNVKVVVMNDSYLSSIASDPETYLQFDKYPNSNEYSYYLIANAIINKGL